MEEEVVLSFHDSLLRRSDVSLLDAPNWLNDKIIAFYFEYLEYNIFNEHSDAVCFITPDVTQFIKLYEGPELGLFLDPLSLHEKNLVVLAVNNNASMESAGGSHWSTLVYERSRNVFRHLDSACPLNSQPARQCSERIKPFLKASSEPAFLSASCPQQENCYDCGVYALCFAETVVRINLQGGQVESALSSINGSTVLQWRTNTKQLISTLASSKQ